LLYTVLQARLPQHITFHLSACSLICHFMVQSLIMELSCSSLDHHTWSCSSCFEVILDYV